MDNDYGRRFFALVEAFRPAVCVECGILDGYSCLSIAQGIKHNHLINQVKGHLDTYDLFEAYPWKHGEKVVVEQRLKDAEVSDYVTVKKGDAFEVWQNYADGGVHFLHVDISNTGEILRRTLELWDPKIRVGGVIAFEGGTEERDQVEWMAKYQKESIFLILHSNSILRAKYVYGTYRYFPGLIVMLKKRD